MTDIHTVQYVAPVFTPRDETGKVNFNIIPGYVDYLLGNGVQGILVGGSAGEGVLQSNKERLSVARAFVDAVEGRMVVIVHAGGVNYRDTLSLCEILSGMEGVDSIMLSAPMFYPYFNYTSFVEYLVGAGKACADKPVLYYHFPSLTRLEYDVVKTISSLKMQLPNFIGLKYTADDESVYKDLVKQKIKIFLGFPSMTLMGAQTQGNDVAFITGPTNFANGQMMKIVDLVLQGNMEKAKVSQNDLDNLMTKIVVEKELMSSMGSVMDFVGIPMGIPTKPLSDLTSEQKKIMGKNLTEVGSEGPYFDLLDSYKGEIAKTTTSPVIFLAIHIGFLSLVWFLKR